MKDGNKKLAITFYLMSLKKDPNNENAIGMLKKLGYQENEQNVVFIILDYYIPWV